MPNCNVAGLQGAFLSQGQAFKCCMFSAEADRSSGCRLKPTTRVGPRSRLFFAPQDYGAFLSTVHCGFLKREKLRANCGRVAAVTGVGLAGAKLGQGFMLSTASFNASSIL